MVALAVMAEEKMEVEREKDHARKRPAEDQA
jgi:hypothetical protein